MVAKLQLTPSTPEYTGVIHRNILQETRIATGYSLIETQIANFINDHCVGFLSS